MFHLMSKFNLKIIHFVLKHDHFLNLYHQMCNYLHMFITYFYGNSNKMIHNSTCYYEIFFHCNLLV